MSLLALAPPQARAATLTWTLDGVTLIGGGNVTGSFSYDAATGNFAAINLSVSGSIGLDGLYNQLVPGFINPAFNLFALRSDAVLASGQPALYLGTGQRTDAGGTLVVDTIQLGTCTNATCHSLASNPNNLNSRTGTVTAAEPSEVPLPASLPMILVAFASFVVPRAKWFRALLS